MLKAIFWWFWSLKSKTVIYQWSRQWIVTNTRTELANNMGGRHNTNWGQTRHHPIHCNGLSNIHSLSEVVRWWCELAPWAEVGDTLVIFWQIQYQGWASSQDPGQSCLQLGPGLHNGPADCACQYLTSQIYPSWLGIFSVRIDPAFNCWKGG